MYMSPGFKWRYIRQRIAFLAFTLISIPAYTAERPLVIGVHPYLPATELVKRFSPLSEYLAGQLDAELHFRIASNYQDQIDAIASHKVDIAFVGPAVYVKLVEEHGKWPLAARLSFSGSNLLRGVIVTRQDSGIKRLSDLKGKRFAFGDPHSTLSSRVPKAMLASRGVSIDDLKEHAYLRNHENVALGVLLGRYDAGGVKEETFNKYSSRGLGVIEYTPWFSSHLFILNRNLPEKQRVRISEALLTLHAQSGGYGILQLIKKKTTALVPVKDSDYDSLREILR
jgi:phosphonate transport system substrate-binding protein